MYMVTPARHAFRSSSQLAAQLGSWHVYKSIMGQNPHRSWAYKTLDAVSRTILWVPGYCKMRDVQPKEAEDGAQVDGACAPLQMKHVWFYRIYW